MDGWVNSGVRVRVRVSGYDIFWYKCNATMISHLIGITANNTPSWIMVDGWMGTYIITIVDLECCSPGFQLEKISQQSWCIVTDFNLHAHVCICTLYMCFGSTSITRIQEHCSSLDYVWYSSRSIEIWVNCASSPPIIFEASKRHQDAKFNVAFNEWCNTIWKTRWVSVIFHLHGVESKANLKNRVCSIPSGVFSLF
jgi:hypothetical protein